MAGSGGHALHLVRRFFYVLTADPLTKDERNEVDEWLTDADRELFWSQTAADQRHALDTARTIRTRYPGRSDVIRAALFHDVGKVRSGLGPYRRSLATLARYLRVRMPDRWKDYVEHGRIGADEMAKRGAEDLVVAFARVHPGPAPAGFDAEIWQALLDADDD